MRARLIECKKTVAGPVALIELRGQRVPVMIDRHATHIPAIAALPGVDQMRVAALEIWGTEWRAPSDLDLLKRLYGHCYDQVGA